MYFVHIDNDSSIYAYKHIILFVRPYIRTFVCIFVRSLRIANFGGKSTHLMWEESKHWLPISMCKCVLSECNLLVQVLVCLFVVFFWLCSPNSIVSEAYTFSQYPRTWYTFVRFSLSAILYNCRCCCVCVRVPLFVYASSNATFFVPLFLPARVFNRRKGNA